MDVRAAPAEDVDSSIRIYYPASLAQGFLFGVKRNKSIRRKPDSWQK